MWWSLAGAILDVVLLAGFAIFAYMADVASLFSLTSAFWFG